MQWSAQSLSGFALAATIAGDRAAASATAGLGPSERDVLCALPRALAAMSKPERRARVAELAGQAARRFGPFAARDEDETGARMPTRALTARTEAAVDPRGDGARRDRALSTLHARVAASAEQAARASRTSGPWRE